MYELYTDGACAANGQAHAKAAWAYILLREEQKIDYGADRLENEPTNQRAELLSLIEGLRSARTWMGPFDECKCYSDSAYCINGINDKWIDNWFRNGWVTSNKQPVKNQDLWRELYLLYRQDNRFTFHKVKGHSGVEWNEKVDRMARECIN